MTGSIRWNVYGGAAAFLITFLASVSRNVFATTLLRSVYSFLLIFALIFLFRFVLHLILNGLGPALPPAEEDPASSYTGTNVDLHTPEDDDLHNMLKANGNGTDTDGLDFAPLRPPKLMTKPDLDPEELANALRRMSEE